MSTHDGIFLISDTVMGKREETGDGFWRAEISLFGETHRRVRNLTTAALFPAERRQELLDDPALPGSKVTVLVIGGTGTVNAYEGRIVDHDGSRYLMKKGSSRKGWDLSRMRVLTWCTGWGKISTLTDIWEAQAALVPELRAVDVAGIPVDAEDGSPGPSVITAVFLYEHPGFGGGKTPGCLFLATYIQQGETAEDTIVNGFGWVPAGSELTSEHGSIYLAQLQRWGGRVVAYPGGLTLADCLWDEIPTSREAAYRFVTQPRPSMAERTS